MIPLLRRAAVAAALLGLLAGCTLGVAENEAGGGALGVEAFPLIAAADRDDAPEVCGSTTDEEDLCLADLAGTPVLLNFWGSWCGPCAREIPDLVAIEERYRGQVAVIGVNEQDTLVNARSFERDQGVTYPSWFDDGAVIAAAFGGIAPEALPSTILLDADHRIAVRLFGLRTEAEFRSYLDDLLAET